jgi:hypothetical protein
MTFPPPVIVLLTIYPVAPTFEPDDRSINAIPRVSPPALHATIPVAGDVCGMAVFVDM